MLNPCILKRLENKGLSVMLNTITGFDTEFELLSSLDKRNDLISVQLVSNTGFYVKVPKILSSTIDSRDFNLHFTDGG